MKFIKEFLFVSCLFFFPLFSYEYDLCICAIFQNEARFLKEWIEFHKLMGVQHFYLYNNLSTDHYLKILRPYIKSGEVELVEFHLESSNQTEFNRIQISAYNHALSLACGKARWVAFIDTDEFLFTCEEDNLVNFLKSYEVYGGLEVNWQVFGTSSIKKIPKNKLMIEVLIRKGNSNFELNHNTKSIVHPHLAKHCTGAHNFAFHAPYYGVYSNYAPSSQWAISPFILIDKIRINHYWTRDEKFLSHVKTPRYKNWHKNLTFLNSIVPQLNEEEDLAILKFVPFLRRK